uniref:Dynamin n=1 Tax=Solanum tuberosum TaxID=4113 RepID=M1CFB1_SOLTU
MCPIITSEGCPSPSHKNSPITSSMRFIKIGNCCNSLTIQRWLIYEGIIQVRTSIIRMHYRDKKVVNNGLL